METKNEVKKYETQSNYYYKNALEFIEGGKAEKASEFLWGSMSQALKAVASSRGIRLRSHRQIRDYAAALARALRDKSIWHAFNTAQSLHSNFYESGLLLEDVIMGAEDVKTVVAKLFRLIHEEATQ